jgi:hypothetical protein
MINYEFKKYSVIIFESKKFILTIILNFIIFPKF